MDYNRFWVLAAKRLSGDATKEELHELDILISTYPEAEQLLTEAKEAWSSATRIAELQTAGEEHVSNLRNKIAGFDDTYVETFRFMISFIPERVFHNCTNTSDTISCADEFDLMILNANECRKG